MSIPRRFRTWASLAAVLALAGAVPVALRTAQAAGSLECSPSYQIDEVLANGARWQLCWERRSREGIILRDVTYTPIGGESVEVLSRASLAQIHVPYDDNGARFHDVSIGIGSNDTLQELVGADCPNGGQLIDDPSLSKNVLCQTESPTGYAYKDYQNVGQATTLNLFSTSCIGAYCYVVGWNFDDDGTVRPEVGATGSLQMYGGNNRTGWPVGGGRRAVAHMHNFYWRLDFDIDGTPANDRVDELEALPGNNRTQLRNIRRVFRREVSRRVSPTTFRSWRVRDLDTRNADDHQISWELLPNTDHVFRGPAWEPFTKHELYVTRYRACERLATQNPATAGCRPGPNNSVAAFANNEVVDGRDVVLWYASSFHHLPRDEDEEHMHPHWTGFSIVPRDLTATNPAAP